MPLSAARQCTVSLSKHVGIATAVAFWATNSAKKSVSMLICKSTPIQKVLKLQSITDKEASLTNGGAVHKMNIYSAHAATSALRKSGTRRIYCCSLRGYPAR